MRYELIRSFNHFKSAARMAFLTAGIFPTYCAATLRFRFFIPENISRRGLLLFWLFWFKRASKNINFSLSSFIWDSKLLMWATIESGSDLQKKRISELFTKQQELHFSAIFPKNGGKL
jgi:hypothetical protein